MLHYRILYYSILLYALLYCTSYTILCYAMLCYIISYYTINIITLLNYALLNYIILNSTTLLTITATGGRSQIPGAEGNVDSRTEALGNGAITGEGKERVIESKEEAAAEMSLGAKAAKSGWGRRKAGLSGGRDGGIEGRREGS